MGLLWGGETGDMAEEWNGAKRREGKQAGRGSRRDTETEVGGDALIADQEVIGKTPAGDGVDILHYATGAVNDSEIITEQFLTPPAEERIRAIVIKQSLKRVAVSDPVKVATLDNSMTITDIKTTRASFASHRVVFGFRLSSTTRTETIGSEARTIKIEIEIA